MVRLTAGHSRSQGADHEDPHGQAVPQPDKADVAVDARDGSHGALAGCEQIHTLASRSKNMDDFGVVFWGLGRSYSRFRSAFNLLTMTSAGWLTTAHPTPAM